jgi:hypothetical protein
MTTTTTEIETRTATIATMAMVARTATTVAAQQTSLRAGVERFEDLTLLLSGEQGGAKFLL